MSVKYLLPCRCGQQLVVEPRWAGEIIACSCGASLQVPTLLEMTALEPAPTESSPPPAGAAWGWRHRMLLFGAILALAAMVAGVWLYLARPLSRFDMIDPELIRQTAKELPPLKTWEIWEMMKQGLDRRIDQQYAAALVRFRVWQAATVVLAVVGAALIVVGLTTSRRAGGR